MKNSYIKPRQCFKKQRYHFANKGPHNQYYGFSSIHVWMWKLDHKEGWALKNWRLWTVVLEKILESLLESKEIKPVNPKGNQPWIFIGRTDGEAEASILWPPDAKNWLIGNDPDAGEDWGQEKGKTENEMIGWHHLLCGHELEQTTEVADGQRSLACCISQGHKELDTTKRPNWIDENQPLIKLAFSRT